jgi:hypothetical protein
VRVLATKVELTKSALEKVNFCALLLGSVDHTFSHCSPPSQMIKTIGGVLIENLEEYHTATHIIVGGEVSRTDKLLVGMSCTPNIVTPEWLFKSAKGYGPLPCDDFLILDKKAEKKYDFSMRETTKRTAANIEKDTKLLDRWGVYVCDRVAGNLKVPNKAVLQCMVEAAGGEWVSSVATWLKEVSMAQTMEEEPPGLLIVTGDPETTSQVSERTNVPDALAAGASKQTVEWLLHTIMIQKFDWSWRPKTEKA